MHKGTVIAALAASLALSACATGPSDGAAPSGMAAVGGLGMRDLSPQEKQAIVEAVGPSLRNPAAAKYRWAKFPVAPSENPVNYCATVDAQSPHAAYDGHQAYIVEAQVMGGRVVSAVMGLIAGGKDFAIVSRMCGKYGLDPSNAS